MPYKDPEKKKATDRVYYQKRREKRSREEGRTYSRRYKRGVYNRNNIETHRQREKVRAVAYRQTMIAQALRILGSKCACPGCGVSERAFLTIDHIHGRSKGSRHSAVLEAKIGGWDKAKFQILCWNCNMSKRDRGFCPVHQADPGQRNGHSPDLGNPQLLLWPP